MRLRNRNRQFIRQPYMPMENNAGFTLLETIVAMAILVIGILGVLEAFSTSMAATKEAEAYSTAAILANQVATQLDNQSSTVQAGQVSGAFDDAPGYTWNANIEAADTNTLVRVTIAIN